MRNLLNSTLLRPQKEATPRDSEVAKYDMSRGLLPGSLVKARREVLSSLPRPSWAQDSCV